MIISFHRGNLTWDNYLISSLWWQLFRLISTHFLFLYHCSSVTRHFSCLLNILFFWFVLWNLYKIIFIDIKVFLILDLEKLLQPNHGHKAYQRKRTLEPSGLNQLDSCIECLHLIKLLSGLLLWLITDHRLFGFDLYLIDCSLKIELRFHYQRSYMDVPQTWWATRVKERIFWLLSLFPDIYQRGL